jgi:hypothetical protein
LPFGVGLSGSYTKKKMLQGGCTLKLNVVQFQKTAIGDFMHSEAELQQAMQERQQMLEEALDRAETGVANEEDWRLIRAECGLPNFY